MDIIGTFYEKNLKIVVGLPAFNEEKHLEKILSQIQQFTKNIIVCNDGSSDNTKNIAKKMGVITINHERNLGYGAAIKSIFLKAKEIDADILITFDADGQHNVNNIESVIEPLKNDTSDIVIGSRFLGKENKSIPKYRKVGIKVITKITNISSDKQLTDSQSGFRGYSKKVLNKITLTEQGMGVSTEILLKANKLRFRITEVPITINYEGDTSTHNPVSHGTSVILSTMKFVSIEHPLKFYGIPGLVFLMIGLFFMGWTIQEFTETRRIITNIALTGFGSLIFGMMLLMTSIILYSLVSVVREERSN